MNFLRQQMSPEDKNLEYVKRVVRRSENPHPMSVVGVIVLASLVLCFLYKKFLKPSVGGTWIDSKQQSHEIVHDKYKDVISVDGHYYGMIKGNLIVYHTGNAMKMGVWIGNEIEWTCGDKWQCARGY
jgi:hypothetical protein